jgi:hypothetical protein
MIGKILVALAAVIAMGCIRSPNQSIVHPETDTGLIERGLGSTHIPDSAPVDLPSLDTEKFPLQPEEEDLEQEAPEVNPLSEKVVLKLSVSPPTKGVVMRGQKVMARLTPGTMEAEWTVPRNGGPLDLEIRADGFLPFHTRLYSDRDDKISVRLYRPGDAAQLWGYRSPSVGK